MKILLYAVFNDRADISPAGAPRWWRERRDDACPLKAEQHSIRADHCRRTPKGTRASIAEKIRHSRGGAQRRLKNRRAGTLSLP